MNKKSRHQHRHAREVFCSINSVRQLCQLLKIDKRRLHLFLQQPAYKTFVVPKKGGGERHIEDPNRELKRVLAKLNRFLQSTYLFEKSSAAYGFIVGVHNDDDRRNVLTNARKHINRDFLLNIDLKDFFHHVTLEKVEQMFKGKPFQFKRDLPTILAQLVTYKGRLPMGAPTSPVLSNLACRELDEHLSTYASDMLWAYTRYADDMTFSSNMPFTPAKIQFIRSSVEQHGFVINENKTQLFGKKDQKIVTGLVVTDKVSLTDSYLPTLQKEIVKLKEIVQVQNEQGQLSTRWVENFKQQVRGRLNFAGFVLKRHHPDYQSLKDKFFSAIHPPEEDFGAINWRGFPYNH